MSAKKDLQSLIVLFIVSVLSAFVLAATYAGVKERIEQNEIKARNQALLAVIPEPGLKVEKSGDILLFYKGDEVKYIATTGEAPGYSSIVKVAVGFTLSGEITAIKIIAQQETPGLGANCENPDWYGQFQNKKAEKLTVVKHKAEGDQIEAITGATITSRAVVAAVQDACNKAKDLCADIISSASKHINTEKHETKSTRNEATQ